MSAKFQQAGAMANSADAKLKAQQFSSQMDMQVGQMLWDMSLKQTLGGRVGAVGGGQQQPGAPGVGPSGVPGMPQGIQVNPAMLGEQGKNAVPMPGGGYGFAPDSGAAEKARAAVDASTKLFQGANQLQQDYNKGATFNPFGRQAKQNEQDVANMMMQAKNLYDLGKISPEQWKQIKEIIPNNPGAWRRTTTQDQLNSLKSFIWGKMNSDLGANIMNYQAPPQPKDSGGFNAGSR